MKRLDSLFSEQTSRELKTAAVVVADDAEVLQTVKAAIQRNLCHFILYGKTENIRDISREVGLKLNSSSSYILVKETVSDEDSARQSVQDVAEGKADILVKGRISTRQLLKAVLEKEGGLRGPGIMSHLSLFEIPGRQSLIILTDAAMNIAPDVGTKAEILRNALQVASTIGLKKPKVAPLAAVETVNPAMQATLDAEALRMMQERGKITGCIVSGPMAFDVAISPAAAARKKIVSSVAGQADILLVPTIETGNALYKSFIYFASAKVASVIVGAMSPIALASRSDSAENRLYSLALALRTTD